MSKTAIVKEQSHSLKILASKNILHPELIKKHFDAFMKLTDKTMVKKILADFCKSCAYVGFTEGIDI